ncbi:hypothetical protein GCM10010492_67050 [Saccharothrix mutabilis subsp. mutabilis]|uniref:Uncharacterized protein n=1 Tax=Saccharothrix mutabilis subsp. mutabilis TaxID=66855 RepID=A0ABN0UNW3_9PSEU
MISTKLDLAPIQWIARLARLHNAEIPELELLDVYYEGDEAALTRQPPRGQRAIRSLRRSGSPSRMACPISAPANMTAEANRIDPAFRSAAVTASSLSPKGR